MLKVDRGPQNGGPPLKNLFQRMIIIRYFTSEQWTASDDWSPGAVCTFVRAAAKRERYAARVFRMDCLSERPPESEKTRTEFILLEKE